MKKFVIGMILVSIMMSCISAFADYTEFYVEFADDFPYKDDPRLSTFGREYDDGTTQMFILVGSRYQIVIKYDEEEDICEWIYVEDTGRGPAVLWDDCGSLIECSMTEFRDRQLNRIGYLLERVGDEG